MVFREITPLLSRPELVFCQRSRLELCRQPWRLDHSVLASFQRSSRHPGIHDFKPGHKLGAGQLYFLAWPFAGRLDAEGATMKRRVALLLFLALLCPGPAGAHIGSPDVFY